MLYRKENYVLNKELVNEKVVHVLCKKRSSKNEHIRCISMHEINSCYIYTMRIIIIYKDINNTNELSIIYNIKVTF